MKVFILFGLLGLASGVLVGCRQSQLPLPVLRFLPASSTLNIQTAVPFSNTTGAGNWNGQQDVTTSGGTPIGIAGSDPVSNVHWFSWEIPYSTATAQNKADEIANNYLTPALGYGPWVVSGYNAWITAAATGAIATGSTASAGTGKATLQALVRALNSITSGLGSATLSYPGADPSYTGWDIALFVMKIPPPVTAPVVQRFIATVTIVPTSKANQANNGAGNVGRESSYFAWKDIYLGQSLASAAHIIAQYCEVFFTSAPKPLDVMFSVDNSGSMGSWQAAVAGLGDAIQAILATSGIDWRIGLTTSAHYVAYSPGTCTATSCGETGTYTCRYFSQDINAVKNWLTSGRTSWIGAGGTCGTGTEKIMYCAQIMLSPTSTTYNNAQSFMPRTPQTVGSLAPNSAFRQATNVLTVYLGDADDQFYSDAASATGIQAFLSFFNGIRTAFNGGFFMAGIICPATQACGETQRSNRVVRGVLSQYPGAAIGDITSVASIQTTIRQVFNSIVATSSPYVLTQSAAIGASVQVLLDASNVLGPCNNSDNQVPRSRQNGFDIEQNTVILFGGCRPSADGRPLVVNYYYWVITQCGDGIVQNDGVTGEQCDPPGACCDSQCRFVTGNNVPCTAGSSCGNGTNFCNAFGVCQATTCPDYPPSQGAPNYCTVALGCVNGACAYQNRTCLPLNCNKRICDRTVNNSNIPGLLGDCVLISAEQGYICDTDYCILDACGWCNGDNSTCKDCSGIPNGNNVVDICGICNKIGAPLQCCSCVPGQESICGPGVPVPDACNVCGGDGLSCKNCATTPGGLVGLDACGVCGGDGLSCGPTYNFQVTIPAGVTSANGDLCIDINASVTGILNTMLGKSTNQYSVTCTPKDSCDITIDPLCFYGQQMFIVSVQQVVFAPTVLSDSGLLALLLNNGLLTGTTLSIPSEIPSCDATCTAQIRADVNFCPLGGCPVTSVTSGTATSATGTGATTAATGTATGGATSSTGSNTNPASGSFNVAITFSSSDIAATLNQAQLNTLAQSTILQLISDGSLTGSSSDYTATTTVNADGTVTISIQPLITATNPTGAWPGGSPPASGTTVHPPFCGGQTPLCPSGGTGTYTTASSSSSSATDVSSSPNASGASSILLSIAVLLLQ